MSDDLILADSKAPCRTRQFGDRPSPPFLNLFYRKFKVYFEYGCLRGT